MDKLKNLREQIDVINDRIVDLLVKRYHISEEVVNYKMEINKPIFDKERENEIYKSIEEKLEDVNYKDEITEVFNTIIKTSKEVQKKVKNGQ